MHSKSQNLVLIANHNWLSTYLKFHLTSNPILIYAQGTQFLCHLLSLISTDSNICFWAFSHFHNIINSKLPKKKIWSYSKTFFLITIETTTFLKRKLVWVYNLFITANNTKSTCLTKRIHWQNRFQRIIKKLKAKL